MIKEIQVKLVLRVPLVLRVLKVRPDHKVQRVILEKLDLRVIKETREIKVTQVRLEPLAHKVQKALKVILAPLLLMKILLLHSLNHCADRRVNKVLKEIKATRVILERLVPQVQRETRVILEKLVLQALKARALSFMGTPPQLILQKFGLLKILMLNRLFIQTKLERLL